MISKLRRFALAVYFFIIFWLLTICCYVVLAIGHFYVLLTNPKRKSYFEHEVANFWGRTFFRLVPGWNYVISGREHLPEAGKAVVIVANHQSAADIFAMFTLGVQFRWLSKREVFYWPFVGRAMTWAGYVPVVRGDAESQLEAMAKSAKWLQQGVSMVFFPEGTRSQTGELGNFKSGAFRLAAKQDVEVLPMVLRGTRNLLVKKSMSPSPATIEICVLKATKKRDDETLNQFIGRIHEQIRSSLEGQNT